MADKITSCPWEPINGFASHTEFQRFCAWITDSVTTKKARKVPVKKRYQGIESFSEDWYQHIQSSTVWRLVHPDGPFRGIFEKINEPPRQ